MLSIPFVPIPLPTSLGCTRSIYLPYFQFHSSIERPLMICLALDRWMLLLFKMNFTWSSLQRSTYFCLLPVMGKDRIGKVINDRTNSIILVLFQQQFSKCVILCHHVTDRICLGFRICLLRLNVLTVHGPFFKPVQKTKNFDFLKTVKVSVGIFWEHSREVCCLQCEKATHLTNSKWLWCLLHLSWNCLIKIILMMIRSMYKLLNNSLLTVSDIN